jgi:acetyl-CoA carboxylase carboxyl transferase subunit alpha
MKPTAHELLKLKVIDEIIREPFGGAHRNWKETMENTGPVLSRHLREVAAMTVDDRKATRYEKFRHMGVFEERR